MVYKLVIFPVIAFSVVKHSHYSVSIGFSFDVMWVVESLFWNALLFQVAAQLNIFAELTTCFTMWFNMF